MKNKHHNTTVLYRNIFKVAVMGTALLTLLAPAWGAEWGSIKGRFVYEGETVKPAKLNANKDVKFCGKHLLMDETIVVGKQGGLANVFVYLYLKRGDTIAIHPELKEVDKKPVVMQTKGCRFEPHALTARVSQTLEIRNADQVGHHPVANYFRNPKFGRTICVSTPYNRSYQESEPYPVEFNCSIHPWMKAHVLIRDNPYMAISRKDGRFEIKNLPAVQHEFIFWHESQGIVPNLKLGNTTTNRKGRAKLEVTAEKTLDLGEIKISLKGT